MENCERFPFIGVECTQICPNGSTNTFICKDTDLRLGRPKFIPEGFAPNCNFGKKYFSV